MEVTRRHRLAQIHDQENVHVIRGKANVLPAKKQGPTVRGALGDINTNVQAQREINIGKVAVTTAEFEKKASACRTRTYNHVQSKIDTGLAGKTTIQPSARPSLRREESTAGHAAKATLRIKAAIKETRKPIEKDANVVTKKVESKKADNVSIKEKKCLASAKPGLNEQTESLGKLKIGDRNSLINLAKLQQASLKCEGLDVTPELPEDVEDIDAGDRDPLILMTTYIKDIYRYLMELEVKYQIEPDHLKNQSVITSKMRSMLLDWIVEVHQQFKLLLETFHLTVGIIDRYLQTAPHVQRNQLQLIGVTALFIACKYEEVYVPEIEDFVYITDSAYSKKEMIRCERDIMAKLSFCLARPIPLSFLRRFVKAAHGNSKNHHLAKYFVDLCLVEYSTAHYRPSELAAASVCLSLHLLSNQDLEDVWTPSLEYYSSYSFQHIEPIVRQIARIVAGVENSKYKSVFNKYKDVTLARVSTLPQLRSENLLELADFPSRS